MATKTQFEDFKFDPKIYTGIASLKYVEPTPIQSETIPLVLEGHDLIGCAQTGTGKTAAFALPILHKILNDQNEMALIVVPTREIGAQIMEFYKSVVSDDMNLRLVLLIGGMPMPLQLKALKKQPRIIIATPGRLVDHLNRKSLVLKKCHYLVLDEADRMLDMGFSPQLDEILKHIPRKRQTLMFSATMNQLTRNLARNYLTAPKSINVGDISRPIDNVTIKRVMTTHEDKLETLLDLLNDIEGSAILFIRTRVGVEKLFKALKNYGHDVMRIHSERSQGQRNAALKSFREGECRILAATDVAARGIDVPHIESVINYDPPQNSDDFIHRIGRTGRAGAKGVAFNIVTVESTDLWENIDRGLKGKPLLKNKGKKKPYKSSGKKKFSKSTSGGKSKRKTSCSSGGSSKKKKAGGKKKTTGSFKKKSSKKSTSRAGTMKRKTSGKPKRGPGGRSSSTRRK